MVEKNNLKDIFSAISKIPDGESKTTLDTWCDTTETLTNIDKVFQSSDGVLSRTIEMPNLVDGYDVKIVENAHLGNKNNTYYFYMKENVQESYPEQSTISIGSGLVWTKVESLKGEAGLELIKSILSVYQQKKELGNDHP